MTYTVLVETLNPTHSLFYSILLIFTDVHDLPEAECVASKHRCIISETVITDRSPRSVVEHLQTPFWFTAAFRCYQPHWTTQHEHS